MTTSKYNLVRADILDFCNIYKGDPFHALLCDPPYHLESIVKRFGKKGSAPAKDKDGLYQRQSVGFMGKEWDGGDIAFQPETWEAIGNLLLPGAFGMAFSATRNYHKLATAIESAGYYIHPMIAWVNGQGFPKASNPQKLLEKRGDDRAETFADYRYGAQALKPVIEPICVFQKPWNKGSQLDNILEHGTGVYDIEASRIRIDKTVDDKRLGGEGDWDTSKAAENIYEGGYAGNRIASSQSGRWPAGLILQHLPECQIIGHKDDNYQINRFDDNMKPWGDAVGESFTSHEVKGKVPVYECAEGCSVIALDEQSGHLKSGRFEDHHKIKSEWGYHGGKRDEKPLSNTIGDSGGASRFFYQATWNLENSDPFVYCAKASRREKDAGLDKRCPHPTLKPLDLCKYLTRLILPPPEYSPRRILVPFAGTGSEMIGAHMAGWDEIVGVELEEEYVEIGNKRLEHWCKE